MFIRHVKLTEKQACFPEPVCSNGCCGRFQVRFPNQSSNLIVCTNSVWLVFQPNLYLPCVVSLQMQQEENVQGLHFKRRFTHSMPCPCRAAKVLECLSHLIYTVRPCLIHTCHAAPMPFFSRPRHSTAVERRPEGQLPAFGFFRLPHGVPRRLLSEAYQSFSQRSIPTTVKSGSNTLQKRRSVKLLD
jgi:hypothetical protein